MMSNKRYSVADIFNLDKKWYDYKCTYSRHPYITALQNFINKTNSKDLFDDKFRLRKADVHLLLVRIDEYIAAGSDKNRRGQHVSQHRTLTKLREFCYGKKITK